jgi:hypothetical protein
MISASSRPLTVNTVIVRSVPRCILSARWHSQYRRSLASGENPDNANVRSIVALRGSRVLKPTTSGMCDQGHRADGVRS